MPSSSRSFSRRRVLAATGSCLGVAVAGCTGDDRGSSSADDSHAEHDATDGGSTRESSHEYEAIQVRADDAERFVFQDEATAAEATADDADDHVPFRRSIVFATDVDEAESLWIDADADVDDEIRSFVAATDFATETIAIDQRTIDDCYLRHLLSVQAHDDTFRTQYCQQLKDPETSCVADKTVMEAIVVRVGRTYDETPSSRGSSESMSCRGPIVRAENGLEDERSASATTSNETASSVDTDHATAAGTSNATAEGVDR